MPRVLLNWEDSDMTAATSATTPFAPQPVSPPTSSSASTRDLSQLRINGPRLWASLMELAQIGATPKGGVCRLTLTDLDKQGRDLVTRWAR